MLSLVILCCLLFSGVRGQVSTTLSSTSTTAQVESENELGQTESALIPESQTNYNTYQLAAQQQRPTYVTGRDAQGYFPYAFQYVAQCEDGSSSRQESSDGNGRVVGSYTLAVEDGRRRVVDYVADQDGFRATVDTNEPGTDVQNPADVVFHSASLGGRSNHVAHAPTNTYRPTTSYRQYPSRFYSQAHVARPNYYPVDNHYYPYNYDSHAYQHYGGHNGQASANYYYNDQRYHWH
ncbi:cuticle protein 16.8-like [Uloborus diversus]|uniref:cuticle protein 16.8-like n=1 Tax=Uloborus diversus TaxID=327109 RepID=UPI002409FCB6|nr:cuticle protein 16.8-like [Uloborus diversus]